MIVDKAAVSRITLETYHTPREINEMRERKIDLSSPDYFFRSKRRDLLLPLTGPVVSGYVLRGGTMSGERKQIPFY